MCVNFSPVLSLFAPVWIHGNLKPECKCAISNATLGKLVNNLQKMCKCPTGHWLKGGVLVTLSEPLDRRGRVEKQQHNVYKFNFIAL